MCFISQFSDSHWGSVRYPIILLIFFLSIKLARVVSLICKSLLWQLQGVRFGCCELFMRWWRKSDISYADQNRLFWPHITLPFTIQNISRVLLNKFVPSLMTAPSPNILRGHFLHSTSLIFLHLPEICLNLSFAAGPLSFSILLVDNDLLHRNTKDISGVRDQFISSVCHLECEVPWYFTHIGIIELWYIKNHKTMLLVKINDDFLLIFIFLVPCVVTYIVPNI